ncbi:unnamed protein product [Amoebophrya sp. A25]|nr:unnamed protein product [Amoebophrya sp. A25]|eukprot:GSA25T00010223001.1
MFEQEIDMLVSLHSKVHRGLALLLHQAVEMPPDDGRSLGAPPFESTFLGCTATDVKTALQSWIGIPAAMVCITAVYFGFRKDAKKGAANGVARTLAHTPVAVLLLMSVLCITTLFSEQRGTVSVQLEIVAEEQNTEISVASPTSSKEEGNSKCLGGTAVAGGSASPSSPASVRTIKRAASRESILHPSNFLEQQQASSCTLSSNRRISSTSGTPGGSAAATTPTFGGAGGTTTSTVVGKGDDTLLRSAVVWNDKSFETQGRRWNYPNEVVDAEAVLFLEMPENAHRHDKTVGNEPRCYPLEVLVSGISISSTNLLNAPEDRRQREASSPRPERGEQQVGVQFEQTTSTTIEQGDGGTQLPTTSSEDEIDIANLPQNQFARSVTTPSENYGSSRPLTRQVELIAMQRNSQQSSRGICRNTQLQMDYTSTTTSSMTSIEEQGNDRFGGGVNSGSGATSSVPCGKKVAIFRWSHHLDAVPVPLPNPRAVGAHKRLLPSGSEVIQHALVKDRDECHDLCRDYSRPRGANSKTATLVVCNHFAFACARGTHLLDEESGTRCLGLPRDGSRPEHQKHACILYAATKAGEREAANRKSRAKASGTRRTSATRSTTNSTVVLSRTGDGGPRRSEVVSTSGDTGGSSSCTARAAASAAASSHSQQIVNTATAASAQHSQQEQHSLNVFKLASKFDFEHEARLYQLQPRYSFHEVARLAEQAGAAAVVFDVRRDVFVVPAVEDLGSHGGEETGRSSTTQQQAQEASAAAASPALLSRSSNASGVGESPFLLSASPSNGGGNSSGSGQNRSSSTGAGGGGGRIGTSTTPLQIANQASPDEPPHILAAVLPNNMLADLLRQAGSRVKKTKSRQVQAPTGSSQDQVGHVVAETNDHSGTTSSTTKFRLRVKKLERRAPLHLSYQWWGTTDNVFENLPKMSFLARYLLCSFFYIYLNVAMWSYNAPMINLLYLRTTREVKVQAQSWSKNFGVDALKIFGTLFNNFVNAPNFLPFVNFSLTLCICLAWLCGIIRPVAKIYRELEETNELVGDEDGGGKELADKSAPSVEVKGTKVQPTPTSQDLDEDAQKEV